MTRIVLAFAATLLLGAGCGSSGGRGRTVVAGFYPLAWAAAEIEKGNADVVNLTPAGAEPHDLELSARDVGKVVDADVVLYLDRGFQPALEHAVEDAKGKTVDLLAGESLRRSGEGESGVDPHVWLDPVRFAAIVERIGDALGKPEAGRALAGRIRSLDRDYERGLAHCERRDIVTSHAAFAYLAERYGLRQIAVTGVSPEAEPSARDLEDVVREVRRSGATTVFTEKLVSPRLAETVARETGVRTAVLDPIEGLTPNELDAGEDYLSRMRANLAALRRALGCR